MIIIVLTKIGKCDRSFNRFKINLEVTALNISKKSQLKLLLLLLLPNTSYFSETKKFFLNYMTQKQKKANKFIINQLTILYSK